MEKDFIQTITDREANKFYNELQDDTKVLYDSEDKAISDGCKRAKINNLRHSIIVTDSHSRFTDVCKKH